MKICLVNPNVSLGPRLVRSYSGGCGDVLEPELSDSILFPPLELLRMASALRAVGADVSVVDLQAYPEASLPVKADCLITTLSLPTLEEDAVFARALRGRLSAERLVILTSLTDPAVLREVLRHSAADEILSPKDMNRGVATLAGVAAAGYVAPDRSLVAPSAYRFAPLTRLAPEAEVVTTANASYGCPYPCGYYCPYPAAEGTKFLPVPLDTLLAEFKQIRALGIGGVVFRDPVFSMDMRRTSEFCRRLVEDGLVLPWWCETRLDRLTPALLAEMRAAGCCGLEIGIESGDPQSQRENTRKALDMEMVAALREQALALGLHVEFLFILGLMGDTRHNIAATLRFIHRLGLTPAEFNLSTITAYPGTAFHAEAARNGWIRETWGQMTGYAVNVRTNRLDYDEIKAAEEFGNRFRAALVDRDGAVEGVLAEAETWAKTG